MYQAEKLSLEQIRMLVSASEAVRFESEHRQQIYGWVESVLLQQEYACQGKAARGLQQRYIEKMAGLSRAQVGQRVHLHRAFVFTEPGPAHRREARSFAGTYFARFWRCRCAMNWKIVWRARDGSWNGPT